MDFRWTSGDLIYPANEALPPKSVAGSRKFIGPYYGLSLGSVCLPVLSWPKK